MGKIDKDCAECGLGQKLKCLAMGRQDERRGEFVSAKKLAKKITPCEHKRLKKWAELPEVIDSI